MYWAVHSLVVGGLHLHNACDVSPSISCSVCACTARPLLSPRTMPPALPAQAAPLTPSEVADLIDSGNSAGGGSGRHWVLDPIDGTRGFVGMRQYAVCLGLLEQGEVRLAGLEWLVWHRLMRHQLVAPAMLLIPC